MSNVEIWVLPNRDSITAIVGWTIGDIWYREYSIKMEEVLVGCCCWCVLSRAFVGLWRRVWSLLWSFVIRRRRPVIR